MRSLTLTCRKIETDHSGTGSEIRRMLIVINDESAVQKLIGTGIQDHPEWCVDGAVVWPPAFQPSVAPKMSDEELLHSFGCGGSHQFAVEIARRFAVMVECRKEMKSAESAKPKEA